MPATRAIPASPTRQPIPDPRLLPVRIVLRSRLWILSPRMTGAATGVLAGLIGANMLEIHCPNLDAWHILTAHLGMVVMRHCGFVAGIALDRAASFQA